MSSIKRDNHKCLKELPVKSNSDVPDTVLFLRGVVPWYLKSIFFWFSVQISYFVQNLFICASPRDPSVISFSSFAHKSPLAAYIDFSCSCTLELCVITFMTLIIAILFCKVEIPFIIYVFTYQSNQMFLLGSVLNQTFHSFAFDDILPWSKKMEKLCDFDWTFVHFWRPLWTGDYKRWFSFSLTPKKTEFSYWIRDEQDQTF